VPRLTYPPTENWEATLEHKIKFLTALELPKKIIEETLTDCAITALKCSRHCTEMLPKDRPQPFIIKFRTIMLIKGHGPDFKLECRQATVV
jgi:Na+/glutamate symporter